MQGDEISNDHHVSRVCGASKLREDGTPSGTAFELRNNEEYLSVNWLEFFPETSKNEQLQKIREDQNNKGRTLPSRGKLAVLNVGRTAQEVLEVTEQKINLLFIHEPEDLDPSHSGIYGLEEDDLILTDTIANSVLEMLPARE